MRIFLFRYIGIIAILVAFLPSDSVHAAPPSGKYGWLTVLSDVIEDDTSCGAGKVNQELFIRRIDTSAPIVVSSALILSINKITGSVSNLVVGSGAEVGPICLDPDTEKLGIDINGGASYYDLSSTIRYVNPALVPRGKLMRSTVWLTRVPGGLPSYSQLSPVNVMTRVNPNYQIQINSFPSTYGATGLSSVTLFVLRYDPVADSLGPVVVNSNFSVSGGVGTKTLPAQSLSDGWYTWTFYAHLNGSHDAANPLTSMIETPRSSVAWFDWSRLFNMTPRALGATPLIMLEELFSGLANFSFPFLLDRTPPVLSLVGHTPVLPDASDTIIITGTATDALAGVKQMLVYVDGILANTCDFTGVVSRVCTASVGPFLATSTHTYYIVATDATGNSTTSLTQNFTVGTRGICGSANGVATAFAPIPSPASVPNNICQSGTPSPIVASPNAFDWTCDGSDSAVFSADDDPCSAPLLGTLKICPNSCTSGGTPYNQPYLDVFVAIPRALYACFGTGTCTDPDQNVVATWTTNGTPLDAIELTDPVTHLPTTTGSVVDIARSYVGTETRDENITLAYNGAATLATAEVICTPRTCDTFPDERNTYCPTEVQKFDDGCGGQTDDCNGTRYCDFNWRELTP